MPLLAVLFLIGFHIDTSTVRAADFSRDDLKVLAAGIATAHGLNTKRFLSTIECESQWQTDAVSKTNDVGLVQINIKAHPEISKEEMLNPLWSMTWMAEQWQNHHQKWWTCYSSVP